MNGYGLWFLVIVNSAVFIIFAASFFHPTTRRDWKAMGAFSGFIVALMVEMYGFPLTIYLLSGWLGSRFPSLTLTHDGGHLWTDLIGWQGDLTSAPSTSRATCSSVSASGRSRRPGRCCIAPPRTAPWRPTPVRTGSSSAIHRLPGHHGRVPAAVADDPNAAHVPRARLLLPSSLAARRSGSRRRTRVRVAGVRAADTAFHPTPPRASAAAV